MSTLATPFTASSFTTTRRAGLGGRSTDVPVLAGGDRAAARTERARSERARSERAQQRRAAVTRQERDARRAAQRERAQDNAAARHPLGLR